MSEYYKPRFSFEISEELQQRANRALATYGLRKSVFSIILEDVLDMVEKRGQMVLGVILDQAVKPREIIPSLAEAERRTKDDNS